jgi:hypothetical protein
MISTGIVGIDEMLGGGIPNGSWILYSLEPGVDGQLFMISTLFSALRKGLSCLVVLPHTTFDVFKHDAAEKRGCSLEIFKKKVVYLDAADRERIQKNSKKPKEMQKNWEARIEKICNEHAVEVVFLYIDLLYDDLGLQGALSVANSAKTTSKTTVLVEHLNLEGKKSINRFMRNYSFDLVIAISSAFRNQPHFDFFTLLHTSWWPVPKRSVPFITTDGRVVPYIPKIVITGPAHSGKSTFVASASDFGVSIDRPNEQGDKTTVAMDFGWLRWRDFDITLFGTPGQTRFDPVVPNLLNHAMAAILMIDATRPEEIERARYHLQLIRDRRLPMVVAANKADLANTMSEGEIRKQLKLVKDVPIFFISAKNKADVQLVLESLVSFVPKVMD